MLCYHHLKGWLVHPCCVGIQRPRSSLGLEHLRTSVPEAGLRPDGQPAALCAVLPGPEGLPQASQPQERGS